MQGFLAGLLGSTFPDQPGLVKGLWDGSIKYTDPTWLDLLKKYHIYDRDMMEAGASGVAADGAPGRFVSGEVAMQAGGTWYAAAIDSLKPSFKPRMRSICMRRAPANRVCKP